MSNVLLDYFFPITSIDPVPAASTSFLKQVLAVVKPKSGATPGFYTLTAATQIATYTDNTDVVKLFNAGLSKVILLVTNDLDIGGDLAAEGAKFYTILISSDFSKEEILSNGVAAIKAKQEINGLTYTAKTAGVGGNEITIAYTAGATAGSEVVSVVSNAITVQIAAGVSTNSQILTKVLASSEAMALVDAALVTGQGSTAQAVHAADNLDGGADEIPSTGPGLDLGAYTGVTAYANEDKDFLEDQAVIKNRVAFYEPAANKAANLFYAFGKFLSNQLNWTNQQYITLPTNDLVTTLGDANDLFDKKISFAITDDEFSVRLGLLVAGGQAITAPYIIRNLQIDMQSAGLQYIVANQPAYTLKQAALLEDSLQKVIDSYIKKEWTTAGTVEVKLEEDNFVASGYINVAEPTALWRIFAEMRQTL